MSLCETFISYNGVEFKNVLTDNVDFTTVYDSTGVDPVGLRVVISFAADIHTSAEEDWTHGARWELPNQIGPGLQDLMQRIGMPRRRFWMQVGDHEMFDINPTCTETVDPCKGVVTGSGYHQDIQHGPRASGQITAIIGDRAARGRFHIEFVRPLCGEPPGDRELLRDLVSLRYWIVDDIDGKTCLTKRTYAGVFRVRGKCVNSHALARQITFPPIQRGYRRESINWSESPNGLELQFSIVDVEQWAMAPAPATHWEGNYSVSVPMGSIAIETELNFRLWADRDLDKRHLFKLANRIIDRKLYYTELLQSKIVIVLSQVWSERLEANEISCSMRLKHQGKDFVHKNLTQFTSGANLFQLGKPLDPSVSNFPDNPSRRPYNKDMTYWPPGAPTGGLAGIFVSALQTPCCADANRLDDATGPIVSGPVLQAVPYTPIAPSTEIAYPEQRYSAEHRETAVYMYYKMTNRYLDDSGWRGFPTGEQCVSNPETASSDTFAFSHMHCPVAMREVSIHACRVDAWPVLPAKQHWLDDKANVKYIFRHSKIEPCAIQLAADGRHDLREVYATYLYYMSKPNDSDKEYLVGNNPYIDMSNGNGTTIETSAFIKPKDLLGGGG